MLLNCITKLHVKKLLQDLLAKMRELKYQITLQMAFRKEIENIETKHSPPIYYNFNTQTVSKNSNINSSFETSYQRVFPKI